MSGIATVASGLPEGKKYRRPSHGDKFVQVKQLPNNGPTIVALVSPDDTFHKFVCPGDDILATDWEEVTA
jgi:hypothetical protein